jgi:uncharacterized protein (DUF2141 family)
VIFIIKVKSFQLALVLSLLVLSTVSFAMEKGIKIRVQGVNSAKGQLLIGIHQNSSTFPSDWQKATHFVKAPITQTGEVLVNIADVHPGTWAIIVVHDLDSNEKMTKNWLGFPLEPFGTSNNPKFYGPPRFSRAVIDAKGGQEILIKLVEL